ncbi:hypothetical protein SODALDRAFT_355633 [Sodiomyces alkalinus F11]|uniref:Uncharacterized protein n=1 Tax=Sodiomyces alkalinus (strain CBS 110278 / VKM F-3762 / F11) TaxID=1314773 RepID=A0A3N2Q9K8_SODAK|nr:hypothetical protein SODALDRAFT_355633 [Sodiomyces alkalinus F11]ROT43426.1 hypothetical protein SODALDRAFT_355633 [Sodiomyces alkalinus F11]
MRPCVSLNSASLRAGIRNNPCECTDWELHDCWCTKTTSGTCADAVIMQLDSTTIGPAWQE